MSLLFLALQFADLDSPRFFCISCVCDLLCFDCRCRIDDVFWRGGSLAGLFRLSAEVSCISTWANSKKSSKTALRHWSWTQTMQTITIAVATPTSHSANSTKPLRTSVK